jgi:negative regulator of flagellin synthesis FlgM
MRIAGTSVSPTGAAQRVPESLAADAAPAPAAGSSGSATLESAVLGPALAALREMSDIDHAKVAELRDALARGEVRFDAARLAGLIERFHGSRS